MQGIYKGFSTLPQSPPIKCMYGAMHMSLIWFCLTQWKLSKQVGHFFLSLTTLLCYSVNPTRIGGCVGEVEPRHRHLSPIRETSWWAKDSALKKVFWSFGKPDQGLYVDVLLTLSAIQGQANVKTTVRVKARGFTEALFRYETILTAQIFLLIFENTSLSKYL